MLQSNSTITVYLLYFLSQIISKSK